MDPITIGIVGAAVVGGIAQFINSKNANDANKAEIDQLKDIASKIQQPGFDPQTLTPQDYQVIGKYVPQVAPHVAELNPTVIQKSPTMAAGQDAQRSALQQLQQVAQSPTNPELGGMTRQALDDANASAQSREASLMDQYQRQGMLNSGTQLAGQLSASEGAMGRAADLGNQAAMDAYRQRLSALQGSASLGGQMVNQDAGIQAQNAGIINAFNQRAANSANQYNQYATGTQNQGQLYNLGNQQATANLNTQTANQTAQQQQQRQDQLKQMGYQDQLGQFGVQSGLGQMQMGQTRGGAQDVNSAIQGITNGAIAGGMYAGSKKKSSAQDDEEDDGAE